MELILAKELAFRSRSGRFPENESRPLNEKIKRRQAEDRRRQTEERRKPIMETIKAESQFISHFISHHERHDG